MAFGIFIAKPHIDHIPTIDGARTCTAISASLRARHFAAQARLAVADGSLE